MDTPDITIQIKIAGHLLQVSQILRCQFLVVTDAGRVLGKIFISNEQIHFTSGNVVLQFTADRRLEEIQLLRHFDVHIKVAMIHRLHLYGKLSVILGSLTSAKSRHTLDHSFSCCKGA